MFLLKKICNQKKSALLLASLFCMSLALNAQTSTWTGNVNTNWNNSNNWLPKTIPGTNSKVIIPEGLTNYPVISGANAFAASITINAGASLKMTGNVILTIDNAGAFNNNGVFDAGAGTVKFAGKGTVNGTVSFNNVFINGNVDLGKSCTIEGELKINANGSVINNPPAYSDTSKLYYNTGTITKTGEEWVTSNVAAGIGVAENIIISNSTTVVLQGNRGVPGTLQIFSNSILSINNHTLKLQGSIKGAGLIKGSANSNLIINGSGAFGTLYFDESKDGQTNVLNNITVNRNSETVIVANKLNLLGTYTPANGVLKTNDTLVFKSYSTGTARVNQGAANGGYLKGIVQVERFIPARRAWRLLSIPVINDTLHLRTAWQEGVNNTDPSLNYASNLNPHPGYGTHITGDNDTLKGFDLNITANPSLKTWDQTNTSWSSTATPTISTLINNYPAYLIFIRGSRAINLAQGTSAVPDSTRLRVAGTLYMGDISKRLSGNVNDFVFLGNPYVSPIDLTKTLDSATNISGGYKFWLWDPKISSNGGYVVYDNGSITDADSYANSSEAKILQSGGAFLIQISRPSAKVTFHETDKVAEQFNVFGKTDPKSEMHVNLFRPSQDSLILEDATTVQFNSNYSPLVDEFDAEKLYNPEENMSLIRDEKALAIEFRPVPQNNDTLFYRLYLFQNTAYRLQIYSQKLPQSMKNAWLVDKYLNTETKLKFNDTLFYDFTSNTDTNSYRNRFMIVFTPSVAKNLLSNYTANKNINDNGSISIYPNPVAGNEIQLQFHNTPNGVYDIYIYNEAGQKVLAKQLESNGATQTYTIPINSLWQQGLYTVSVINNKFKVRVNIQFVIDK